MRWHDRAREMRCGNRLGDGWHGHVRRHGMVVLQFWSKVAWHSCAQSHGVTVSIFWPVARFVWRANLWKILVGVRAWLFLWGFF